MAQKPSPICLACDLQPNSGEGRLALLYMRNAFDLKIESLQKQSLLSSEPGDVLTPVLVNGLRWRRAVSAYLWLLWQVVQLHFVRKADVVVLNYLPLWNIFFFLWICTPQLVLISFNLCYIDLSMQRLYYPHQSLPSQALTAFWRGEPLRNTL